jgi:HEPN domain-containing protein/predicted nucleotidyltransferase
MTEVTRFPPDDPREWLNRARSNLRRASDRKEGVYLEDLCCDAQQAAEKAIKAVFTARGVRFPYVHDLEALLSVLEEAGQAVPAEVRVASRLTRFAGDARYPTGARVAVPEHARAVVDARVVVQWAEAEVAQPGRLRERRGEAYQASARPSAETASGDSRHEGDGPDPALLGEVVARIVAAVAPDRIILFGSGVRGAMGPDSDLDLLIVKGGTWRRQDVDDAIRRSLRGLGVAIDLVLTTPADLERYGESIGLVYRPALEEGRAIYEAGT